MSIEGCPHGPSYLTGGPDSCPDCLKERDAAQDSLRELAAKNAEIERAESMTNPKPNDSPSSEREKRLAEIQEHIPQLRTLSVRDTEWLLSRLSDAERELVEVRKDLKAVNDARLAQKVEIAELKKQLAARASWLPANQGLQPLGEYHCPNCGAIK